MNQRIQEYFELIQGLEYPDYASDKLEENLSVLKYDMSIDHDISFWHKHKKIINSPNYNACLYRQSQDPRLKALISQYLNVSVDSIVITAGCDGALRVISKALVHRDVNVCIPLPSFYRYEYHARVNEGKIHFLPFDTFPYAIDLNELKKCCVKKSIDVVYLANPNSPTGTIFSKQSLIDFLQGYNGFVILDEALADYPQISYVDLIAHFPNLIITRSFSKLFGLAGMRVGYLIANSDLSKVLEELVSPFEVNSIALELAKKVLLDKGMQAARRKAVDKSISIIKKGLANPLIQYTNSQTSNILIKYNGASDLWGLLKQKGILTVSGKEFRSLDKENSVRVTIKDCKAVKYLVEVLNGLIV